MITIELPSTIDAPLSRSSLTSFLDRARTAVGLRGDVEVLLTTDAQLKRLNKSFRGKNKSTDVLSFPTPAEIAQIHAGDLAISVETAAHQAQTYGHTLRDEVRILLLHGLLHLSGLDHETDKGEMAAREADLRRQLRLPTTLIQRTLASSPKRSSSRAKAAHLTELSHKPSSRPNPEQAKRAEGGVERPPHFARIATEPKTLKNRRGQR
jgi:probable rRNA maturation factor